MAPPISKYPWSGVLCLEGEWNDRKLKDQSSVLPGLEMLRRLEIIQYIHRDVGTAIELRHYLDRWWRERLNYNVLYLAFHGTSNGICVTDGKDGLLSTEELGAWLEGRLEGRVVHFGACSVLLGDLKVLRRFMDRTGAVAISGYREDVDWVDSMAWELQYLQILASFKTISTIRKHVGDPAYRSLRKALGFDIVS